MIVSKAQDSSDSASWMKPAYPGSVAQMRSWNEYRMHHYGEADFDFELISEPKSTRRYYIVG